MVWGESGFVVKGKSVDVLCSNRKNSIEKRIKRMDRLIRDWGSQKITQVVSRAALWKLLNSQDIWYSGLW